MGFLNRDDFMYKGYNIYLDKQENLWYIRKGGKYGVNAGTSPDREEAKRIVDGLTR